MSVVCDIRGQSLKVPIAQFPDPVLDASKSGTNAEAVLAAGCFWCIEAVFKELRGVQKVTSGYAGGDASSADYRSVCSGRTGHAEVIRITYDPSQITFGQLLKVFFSVAHDPTQLNRQGNDVGTQYRSAIFYNSEEQRNIAQRYIDQLNQASVFAQAIATKLEPLGTFYEAEAYHQDYAAQNPNEPYIRFAAQPKVEKLREYYADQLKRD